MSNFMKIGPVGTELLRKNEGWTDGRTDRSNEAKSLCAILKTRHRRLLKKGENRISNNLTPMTHTTLRKRGSALNKLPPHFTCFFYFHKNR